MTKNSKNVVMSLVVVIVVVLIIWLVGRTGDQTPDMQSPFEEVTGDSSIPLPVSETTKVSNSLSKYQNAELGFAVQYPNTWEKGDAPSGVQFIIPIDQSQVSTVNRLEADITVSSGKCAFPPVTTVDERKTVTFGDLNFNMISISNTVQGRSYFNRMYSLEKTGICYFFAFSYISLSPDSKGLTGSNLTQAQNNNKALKATADAAFTAMVKTLTFVAPPAGESEASASPAKK